MAGLVYKVFLYVMMLLFVLLMILGVVGMGQGLG